MGELQKFDWSKYGAIYESEGEVENLDLEEGASKWCDLELVESEYASTKSSQEIVKAFLNYGKGSVE